MASPSQRPEDLRPKVALYLNGGTRLVWLVWPKDQYVDVWHPRAGTPTVLDMGDILDGEDVVPGFQHPVRDIFTDDLD